MAERVGRARGDVALIAGRYELMRELRADQEALDWEAFDLALERRVILRFLRPELSDDSAAVERFWSAARAAARVTTAAGERILDGGTDVETGRVFLVREWPVGSSTQDANHTVAVRLPTAMDSVSGWSRVTPSRVVVLCGLVLVGVLGVWVLRSGLGGWLAWVNEPLGQVNRPFALPPVSRPPAVGAPVDQTASATAGPSPTMAGVAPKSTAPETPRVTPTPGPPSGVMRRVVNTDGRGVALRAAPGGDRLPGKGYDEGSTVTAFESVGEWTHIRGSDGREGWVLSVTLAP